MRTLISVVLSLLLLSLITQPCDATTLRSPAPYARSIEVIDGIDLGDIQQISHSKDGLTWLATDNGLVQFDGYNAKRFVHNPADSTTIGSNTLKAVIEGPNGQLWIATDGAGLNKFERLSETFSYVPLPQRSSGINLTTRLNSLTLEGNYLWVAGHGGVLKLNTENDAPVPLPFDAAVLNGQSILKVFIDSNKQLWFITAQNGVYLFAQNQLRHLSSAAGLASLTVLDIDEDDQGNIWLGTAAGLHRFTPQTQTFESIKPQLAFEFKFPDPEITAVKADHLGRLWLGSRTNGVYMYEPKTGQFSELSGATNARQDLKAERINSIYRDVNDTIWLTTDDGLMLVSKSSMDIRYLTNEDNTFLISDITPLDDNKVALVGSYLYYEYNPDNNTAAVRFADENRLYRITKTSQGNLLFATLGQGLQLYSTHDDSLYQMPHAKPLYSDIPVTGLFDVFVDNKEQTWLLPFPDLPHLAGGIIQMDWQTQQYQTYLSSPFISDIIQLNDEQLLLSSDSKGLMTLDINTKQVARWQPSTTTTPRRIIALFKDSQDNLWLGTRGQGLAKFNPDDNSFSYYSEEQGLVSDSVYSIIEDQQHNLWLGTDKGLSRLNPETAEIIKIEAKDGLLFPMFYKRSAAITADGRLLFGAQNALVSLDPKDFAQQSTPPKVLISDFKLMNRSVEWRSDDEQSLLTQPIHYTESLQLTHKHHMFSFEFAATEYDRPDAIRFAYMMEGLNNDWVYTDAKKRVANFSTLPKGDYVFRVKASNRYGQWSEDEARINISVSPPWWLSWPAFFTYAILLTLVILLYINLRTKQLVQRAQLLEKNVAERTAQLQHSRDQVTELLAQKQQLFASVSHEFRTPLTLILSPIEQLLNDPKGKPFHKELNLVKRNGRRLLRMVDQLLEFAKLELKDNSQMEPVSLKQTLDIIVSSFEPLVKTKQIELHLTPYEDATLNMLPDSLNKILINILSNAFKYSPPQSHIYISVERFDQNVAIAIRDTGIGISESDIQAVFQRFNRATQSHGEAIPGAGIGLALVKELVEANFGSITLESEVNVGSTFTVTLPVTEAGILSGTFSEPPTQELLHEQLDLEINSVNTAQMTAIDDKPSEPEDQQKSILIVDDNPDLRDLLYQQLNQKYHCLLAENGQIGLDMAREQLPDLVISDVMMPIMDGYQLTSALKSDEMTSHIPVILLTAKGSTESRLKGLQLLVDDYLAKPFNMEELLLRIHNILTIRDIIKQKFRQVLDSNDPSTQMNKLSISDPEQAFVNRVNEHLSKFYENPEFTAKILSKELGVSERQLQRKLKSQFDLSFPELVRNYRLNKAIEMLAAGQRASQIYHLVGFSSHSYFSSCFKAKFGQTPKEYQQEASTPS